MAIGEQYATEFAKKGSRWVSLKHKGDSTTGIILGSPRMDHVTFDRKANRYMTTTSREAPRKWCSNFYVTDTSQVQVLEGSYRLGQALFESKLSAETDILTITRQGEGLNTSYDVRKVGDVSEDLALRLAEAPRFDLTEEWGGGKTRGDDERVEMPF